MAMIRPALRVFVDADGIAVACALARRRAAVAAPRRIAVVAAARAAVAGATRA